TCPRAVLSTTVAAFSVLQLRLRPHLLPQAPVPAQLSPLSLHDALPISTTPVIAGDSFEMDAVGALRLSPLRRGLAIDKDGERQQIGRAVQQECRDRSRMPSSACKKEGVR